jgi:hypothetical protein
MADYNQLKNASIFLNPAANIDLGTPTSTYGNLYMSGSINIGDTVATASSLVVPKVSSITYVGNDTAADTTGGQTLTINGSGFSSGLGVYVDSALMNSSTVINSTTVIFTSPAKSAGTYSLMVVNTDGGTASLLTGIQYSGIPSWSTSAGSLGSMYEYASVSTSVAASSSDTPVVYTVTSGALPSGVSLNSTTGAVTGTAPTQIGTTTYNFTISASDAQNQDTPRNFSFTITPDLVTWSSPAANTSYTLSRDVAIANVTLTASSAAGKSITYTANALPTGVTLTTDTISGTPTTAGDLSTLLTATAATTGKTATRVISWSVLLPAVNWAGASSSPEGSFIGTAGDYFATALSLSGDGNTVVFTAPYNDEYGTNRGKLYIYTRSGTTWTLEAGISDFANTTSQPFAGQSVTLSYDGNTMLIGDSRSSVGATNSGAVHVYVRSSGSWSRQTRLQSTTVTAGDWFGKSVSVSGDGNTAVIGSESTNTVGTNKGCAYIFTRSGTTWTQQTKLYSSDAANGDNFAVSVSMSRDGTYFIAGSPNKGAYIFTGSSSSWSQQAKLTSSDGSAGSFASLLNQVSINYDGSVAIVGANTQDTEGCVYIYTRSSTTWSQVAKISNPDPSGADGFGYSVSVSGVGDTIAIGVPWDTSANAAQGDAGSMYMYTGSGSTWTKRKQLYTGLSGANGSLGQPLQLSYDGKTVAAGAIYESGGGRGYVFAAGA